jgi:diaminopimelate epimerase
MRIRFTKMQGAGNDFVVLDETRGTLGLTAAQYRFLADRHFGVGADQILTVRRPSKGAAEGVDFRIRDPQRRRRRGGAVRQRRALLHALRARAPPDREGRGACQTLSGVIEPRMNADGRVTVDMGPPVFEPARVPFDTAGLDPQPEGSWHTWHLALGTHADSAIVSVAVLSMGNPHAVQVVDNVETAPVAKQGPLIEHHPRFPQRVNAGFMQVVDRTHVKLRVFERGAGETLACGTGACAAVVAGIRLGLLESRVDVQTHGGVLTIGWEGEGNPVLMTGPATTVFEGDIEVPELP